MREAERYCLRMVLFGLVAVGLLSGCQTTRFGQAHSPVGVGEVIRVEAPQPPSPDAPAVPGIRLSEGQAQPEAPESLPLASATPLSAAEVDELVARVPTISAQPGDAVAFKLPATSLPPPQPGSVVPVSFPPQATPPAAPTPGTPRPLAVLRFSPEGPVALAPNLSVTFNQPMVALTGVQDLSEMPIPVILLPEPPGKWRWVGTQTIVFEPSRPDGENGPGRFPMATHYSVSVPAGTESTTGGKLADEVSWNFTTPPPSVLTFAPQSGPTRLEPLMFAEFDQGIEPAAILSRAEVVSGGRRYVVRLATESEIKKDPLVSSLAAHAQPGRWLAFAAAEPFPGGATINVTFSSGTPSAEGPDLTVRPQAFSFSTYGALRVVSSRCNYGDECPPLTPWSIEFSNPLNTAAFSPSMVRVDPDLPGMEVDVFGSFMNIAGASAGQTTYTVTLSQSITDIFGQELGSDATVTFQVGRARPVLYMPGESLVVLDPAAGGTISVFTVNYSRLSVRGYRVTPADWGAYREYLRQRYSSDAARTPPGTLVLSKQVAVAAVPDQLVETSIDLHPGLQDGIGQLVLVVEGNPGGLASLFLDRRRLPPPLERWVEGTRIGLSAAVESGELLAWASALDNGAALDGVKLRFEPQSANATTTLDGLATLPLPESGAAELLVAELGNDTAILPANPYAWSQDGWQSWTPSDRLRWFVFDDRGLYRPGETAYLKGWIRRLTPGPTGDVSTLAGAAERVRWLLRDSQGNQVAEGDAELNAWAGFDLSVDLPEGMNLGDAYFDFQATGGSGGVSDTGFGHRIQVAEFRRPEFEVATSADPGPYFTGEGADVEVTASYYSGGGLPNAEATWQVTSRPGTYTPPGWEGYTFGKWVPWWRSWGGPDLAPDMVATLQGLTDAGGKHRLHIDFEPQVVPGTRVVRAEATVMDVNRQAWTSGTDLLVHPAAVYVGLRTERAFVDREEPLRVELVVVDVDGRAVPDRKVTATASLVDWEERNGRWVEVEANPQPCTVTSASNPVSCTFETPIGGEYRIKAVVADDEGRVSTSELTAWVSGADRLPQREATMQTIELIPDRKSYAPGDTAEILIQAPFFPAEGLLTLRREGLAHEERFSMDGPSTTLRVAIDAGYVPNIHVQVDLVGAARSEVDNAAGQVAPGLHPAFASGSIDLSVPPDARVLQVSVQPGTAETDPGSEVRIELTVRDAAGAPVPDAEIAVVMVDEAVLALTNYVMADPMAAFYAHRDPGVRDYYLRNYVVLDAPEPQQGMAQEGRGGGSGAELAMEAPAMAAAPAPTSDSMERKAASNSVAPPIDLRTNFEAVALFAPSVVTGTDGTAEVRIRLPDSLTRYRVMAVASSGVDGNRQYGGKEFGQGESSVTARLALMVRPSPPRFLNFGDRFELPVVLQNQTDAALEVDVAVQGANVGFLPPGFGDSAGYRVTVPARDRVEVRFPAATLLAGTARFQAVAAAERADGKEAADAAGFDLPVYTPATTEAFAVYGVLDSGSVAQPVIAPTDVFTQFGSLDITTSSTAMQSLTDAVLSLIRYPFECSEQVASRVLGVAALRDVLTAFEARGLPSDAAIEASMKLDIDRLRAMQNSDGGFPIWRRGDESWPFHSIHATHALASARAKGYTVPREMLDMALVYLQGIETRYPGWYSMDVRNTLTAYALNVRWLAGDTDAARAQRMVDEVGVESLPFEALGWILPILSEDPASTTQAAAIRRHLDNRVAETAGAAHFVTSYGDQGYVLLHSDRRVDGIMLDALILDQPDSDLIPKLVRGLQAHRTNGHWSNTQEDVFILLSLDRYFRTYESETPDFVASMWLGEQYAGSATFQGRTTDYQRLSIPMSYVAGQEEQDLILAKDGAGRLYYRLGMQYAPLDLALPPYDAGFTVERVYEGVDDPADVRLDPDGTWRIRAGARVRSKLTLVAPARRYHVALVDPLPAGLEALDPDLTTSGSVPGDPESSPSLYTWWGPWYEHQNLRDARAEAFTSLLWDGVYTYSYVARATTPGSFVVPPAKAEEMYFPETFGRSAVDRVIVE